MISLCVPKLSQFGDMGVNDWDDEWGYVEATPLLAEIEQLLEAAADTDFATN